ncbi:MAG: glycosyltransferase family 4 protein [Lachnospiraceae bacterium]|nr:glycosyltransferase family 4 protein [Lachnospiraceae bacterium]
MQITFVSNYINHHQIPFCEAVIKRLSAGDGFTFIQTSEMEDDRKSMGWDRALPDYVRLSYTDHEENEACRELILESDVVIFGGCEDESYISPRLEMLRNLKGRAPEGDKEPGGRLKNRKLTFRYSERVYKEGQWKFITPRGLRRKYLDHTRYNDCPVYLLCSGGYVASDFSLFKAYKNKMFKWGYFPKINEYDPEKFMEKKGFVPENGNDRGNERLPFILWSGRMLNWKHPELAVETAEYLKEKGLDFRMRIIGEGPERERINDMVAKKGLSDKILVEDFKSPGEIRALMEQADIYLFTSDRREGWGAVANESLGSCCALVAGSMIGAVPYLLKNGINSMVYEDGAEKELFEKTEMLLRNPELRKKLALKGYETVRKLWNADTAAERFLESVAAFREGRELPRYEDGPFCREVPKPEKRISKTAAGK